MAKLDSLIVDLQANTAGLRKGLDDAKGMFDSFGAKLGELAEGAIVLEGIKLGMEAIAKAGEFMERGIKDAASLGSGPARELGETLEHVGLATRQLGADLMSDLAPAFNALIEHFIGGVDWGKVLAEVATLLGLAFRMLVEPLVFVAGALKGLAQGGNLESALKGAAEATAALAKHGKDFAGSLKTAAEIAREIAGMQQLGANYGIAQEGQRMANQYANLTGDRRQDRFAGATAGFSNFDEALHMWEKNMYDAAEFTKKAAVAESYGSKIDAESFRLQAQLAAQAADKGKLAADGFRVMKEKLIQDTQAINNIKFNLGETIGKNARNASIRTEQYNNTYDPTRGFKDFSDALDRQTKALNNQAGLMAAADMIEKQFGAAAQGTVLALKAQADAQGEAASAAKAAADAFFTVKDKLRDQLVGALQVAGESFVSKLGELGTVINAGVKGFQSGGIWGAILAVLVELLSKFEGFMRLIDIGKGQIQVALKDLGGAFKDLIDGIRPLMGAIGMIAHVLHDILAPIISFIGKALGSLAPVFALISVVLEPIATSLQTLFDIIGQTLQPAFMILNGIATGLALVFLGLNEAVLWVKAGLLELVKFLDHTFNPTGNHSGVDQAVTDAWAALHANEKQMDDIAKNGLGGLADKSADAAEAMGKSADQTDKATRAMAKYTDQLTNAPTGFRYAFEQYSATTPTPVSPTTGFLSGGPPKTNLTIVVQGSVISENSLMNLLDTYQRKKTFRTFGTPVP